MADQSKTYGIRMTADAQGLVGATKDVTAAQAALEGQLKQTAAAAKSTSDEAARFVARLKEEAETIGKTRAEMERYRMGQLGLSAAQRDSAEISIEEVQAYERKSQAMNTASGIALAGGAAILAYATSTALAVKHIIDESAQLHNLSQSLGVSAEGLSGYRYAMSLASVSNEEFEMGMKTLAKNISEAQSGAGDGAALFKLLGDNIYQAARQGQSLEQILPMLADAFSKFADGPNKTALALALFGRAGERMIPLLNQGAAGFRAAAEEAKEFGRIIGMDVARQADEFNNNMVRVNAVLDQTKQRIATELLPELNALAEAFIRGGKEGGTFKGVWEGLKEAFEPHPSAEVEARQKAYFDTRIADMRSRGVVAGGPTLEGQQLAALLQGQSRFGTGAGSRPTQMRNAVDPNSPFFEFAGAGIQKQAPPVPKADTGPSEYARLTGEISSMIGVLGLEAEATDKVTQAERTRMQIQSGVEAGTIKLTKAQQVELGQLLDTANGLELQIRQREIAKKALEEMYKSTDAQRQFLQSQADELKKLREHNEEIGLTTEQLGKLKVQRAEETLAIAEQNLALDNLRDASEQELEIAQKRVENAKEFVRLVREGSVKDVSAEQAKKATEEWKRTADNIERALTDSIIRGFDKGKGFIENFKDAFVNSMKTAVLTPIISPVVKPIATAISQAMESAIGSVFGSGSSSLLSGLSSLGGGAGGGGVYGPDDSGTGPEAGGGQTSKTGENLAGNLGAIGAFFAFAYSLDQSDREAKNAKLWLAGEPGSFHIGQADVRGGAANVPYYTSFAGALNDPKQFDQEMLRNLVQSQTGTFVSSGPGSSPQELVAMLMEKLAPAREKALELEALHARAQALLVQLGTTLQFSQAVAQFRERSDALLLSDLSPLTNQQRLDTARGEYSKLLDEARGGDTAALGNLSGGQESYLREARNFYASSPAYTAIFEGVRADSQSLIDQWNNRMAGNLVDQAQTFADMKVSLEDIAVNTADMAPAIAKAVEEVLAAQGAANADLVREQTVAIVQALIASGELVGRTVAGASEAAARA